LVRALSQLSIISWSSASVFLLKYGWAFLYFGKIRVAGLPGVVVDAGVFITADKRAEKVATWLAETKEVPEMPAMLEAMASKSIARLRGFFCSGGRNQGALARRGCSSSLGRVGSARTGGFGRSRRGRSSGEAAV
jgi:hypothetical protein